MLGLYSRETGKLFIPGPYGIGTTRRCAMRGFMLFALFMTVVVAAFIAAMNWLLADLPQLWRVAFFQDSLALMALFIFGLIFGGIQHARTMRRPHDKICEAE